MAQVILALRSSARNLGGGDAVQARHTASELTRLGLSCELQYGDVRLHRDTRIVHYFNSLFAHEALRQSKRAREAGVRFVLSPIWHEWESWDNIYRRRFPYIPNPFEVIRFVQSARRGSPALWAQLFWQPSTRLAQMRLLQTADALLPNSRWEAEALKRNCGVAASRINVVPNGVSSAWIETPKRDRSCSPHRLICVGRVEPLKNQVALTEVFLSMDLAKHTLTFVGQINPAHSGYARRFLSLIDGRRTIYREQASQQELMKVVDSSDVVLHGSAYETTGLVVMEGLTRGLIGCVSDLPVMREYYADSCVYFDPNDPVSIRSSIQEALGRQGAFYRPPTWTDAAQATLATYQKILG